MLLMRISMMLKMMNKWGHPVAEAQTRAGMAAIANSPSSGVKAYESSDKNKLIFQQIK